MASYKAAIKKAIKAAGFTVEEFEITSTGFEPNWEAARLAGVFDADEEKTIKKQNGKLAKVAKALVAAGYRVTTYTARWGGKFSEINEYRHSGHEADFNSTASVCHY